MLEQLNLSQHLLHSQAVPDNLRLIIRRQWCFHHQSISPPR
jgi:hypothetical protein